MLKPLDKVAEAYYGGMGEQFSRKTRERIHWSCSKVKGMNVLDIGCSQGIAELILAKEGKYAVGIDIQESAISYALSSLENESETIKKNVEYHVCSVFDYKNEIEFDTVILTEVLEHFTSSEVLLERAKSFLKEEGTVVVTVPFGINDYFDHKKTYYMLNLIEEIESHFAIKEIKFFGKWMGVVAQNSMSNYSNFELNRELVTQLEDAFYHVERTAVDDSLFKSKQLEKLNIRVKESEEKLAVCRKSQEDLDKVNKELENENRILQQEIQRIKEGSENSSLKNQEELQRELLAAKEYIRKLENDLEQKNKDLLERLDSEEETLEQFKDYVYRYNQLEAKYVNISKKYTLLSNAKLGRLTLRYWKYRKRIPDNF